MAWADHEPEALEAKANRLQKNRDDFLSDIDYVYGIFNRDESELIGGTGLHTRRGPDTLEIGYWISAEQVKQGFATEAAAALTKVAFEVSRVPRVEVRCDPNNVASSRVPMKLGFTHEQTLENDDTTGGGQPRDTMVWAMTSEDYSGSDPSKTKINAFDAVGDSIPLGSHS